MPGNDSSENFEWAVVYDSGETITQSKFTSYDNLPDKQRILSIMILHKNKVYEYINCPEDDYYPFWVHRKANRNGIIHGMHIIAKIHVNTKEPKLIKFILDNGQVFDSNHWWTDHAYFHPPEFLTPEDPPEVTE